MHFAAHGWIDEERPERSAVFLAPGSESQDGLLQLRDIVELDLEGRVVVLSACSTASGQILPGEGVMSLARGFFQAGARVVIASLWPLRDDEAEELFTVFYTHLAGGSDIASALGAAKRDRIRSQAPAAAWAGLVVLGDGAYVTLPDGSGSDTARRPWVAAVVVSALVVLAPILYRYTLRRRRTGSTPPDHTRVDR